MRRKPLPNVQQKSIDELMSQVHKTRRETMRPVFEHPRDYVLLNIREFGQKLHVDPATISRTVAAMGFSSYREFQKYLHQLSTVHSTGLERMRTAETRSSTFDGRVRETLRGAVHNLESVCNSLDLERLGPLADRFYNARRIYILAGDLAVSLGYFLHYQLMMLGFDVALAQGAGHVTHLMRNTSKSDLVIAISFRRGLRQTVEGVIKARERGCYTIGITDTFVSPLAHAAHETLLVSIDTAHFGASYVAPMAMLDALLSGIANRRHARTMAVLRHMDEEQRSGYRWFPELQGGTE